MRKDIRMPVDDMLSFLGRCQSGVLASIGPHGLPHQVTINYALDGMALRFTSFAKAQKVVNMRRDPRVSILVETPGPYAEIKGVLVRGEVEVLEAYDDVLDTVNRVAAQMNRTDPDALASNPAIDYAETARKRVALRLTLDNVVTWDHSRLGAGVY